MLSLDSCPVPLAGAISCSVDLEAVLVLPERGTVHVLNEAAARLWSLLDARRTVRELAVLISQEYEVGPAEAEADVLSFLHALESRGMVADGPAPK